MGEGEDKDKENLFFDEDALDALNKLAKASEDVAEEIQEETQESDLESVVESEDPLGEVPKQIVLDNGVVIDLEEVKPHGGQDTSVVSQVSINQSFQEAIAAADTESLEQAQAETRIEAPVPPYTVLFVGSIGMIQKIKYDYIHRNTNKKIKIMTMSSQEGQDLEINNEQTNTIIIEPGEYDDDTLEKHVKETIKKPAASNLYHIMIACCEDPETSAKIVRIMRGQHLKREEGFMMPYVIIGKLPIVSKAEVCGRNVYFFDPDETEQGLKEIISNAINDSYKEEEYHFKILLMTKDKDLNNPYEKVAPPPKVTVKYFVCSADSSGYGLAKTALENDNFGAVVVDGDNMYQKRLMFRVRNEYPNTIPMAFADSEEMAKEYGAEQFDLDSFKTPEKRLDKLVTSMKDRLKFVKFIGETQVNVEFVKEETIVLTDEGKAYRKVRPGLLRKKFE